ncbi:MAG TPA: hypothetical protein VHM23_19675 [Actinomycetota bacterium]|nr:hypothetical protein [Actinomycetota bacterium]
MRVAVLSSLYGDFDQVMAPVAQTVDADWILVSDRDHNCWPWKVVVEPRSQLHPRLAAKVAKCRPDLYATADAYVWVDAGLRIGAPDFLAWCLDTLGDLSVVKLAQVPHPQRTSIADEAQVSSGIAKYAGLPVVEQARHYLEGGFPDGWGLWATGLIAYRNGPWLGRFGNAWLAEQVRWTYQDQLSQAPLLYDAGLRPVDLDGGLWGNPRFGVTGHRSDR